MNKLKLTALVSQAASDMDIPMLLIYFVKILELIRLQLIIDLFFLDICDSFLSLRS